MSLPGAALAEIVQARSQAIWVRVEQVRGSAPREPGASMCVTATQTVDTIGGGHVEFEAIAQARRMLVQGERLAWRDVSLGASHGQCCGGRMVLSWRRIDVREKDWVEALAALDETGGRAWLITQQAPTACAPHTRLVMKPPAESPADAWLSEVEAWPWPVWVFGAGHVGEALVRVLATLPLQLTWVDPRPEVFPAGLPSSVQCEELDSPVHAVSAIPSGADVFVLTHSHALDFDLCRALLARDDLCAIGLIGSATKAARFRSRLARMGTDPARIARLRCPIGTPPTGAADRHRLDRHPGAIAVAAAHELWSLRRAQQARLSTLMSACPTEVTP